LSTDFYTIINSQNALIDEKFPDIHTQYLNPEWKSERAILAIKNVDVNDLNFKTQQLLPEDFVSYRSIGTVCDSNETVNYQTVLELIGFARHAAASFTTEGCTPYYFAS